jgi:hypothetical protein
MSNYKTDYDVTQGDVQRDGLDIPKPRNYEPGCNNDPVFPNPLDTLPKCNYGQAPSGGFGNIIMYIGIFVLVFLLASGMGAH